MTGLKDIPLFLVYQFLSALFFLLPRPLCLGLGRAFGRLAFRLDAKHRRLALSNLRLAFGPGRSPREYKQIARSSFAHFGQILAEMVKWPFMKEKCLRALIRKEGEGHLLQAIEKGRGVLVFTAHYGNWELGSLPASRLARLHVIARELDNKLVERKLLAFRRRMGAQVIYKHQAARQVLQVLHHQGIVAILIDQNVLRREGVFVDFFGRPASTTPALAALHLRTGAPILPYFCHPEPDGSYRLQMQPPVTFQPSDHQEQDVLKLTQLCTKIIEAQIREKPEYWLWLHDRWRSRPSKNDG